MNRLLNKEYFKLLGIILLAFVLVIKSSFGQNQQTQDSTITQISFLKPAEKVHPKRLGGLIGMTTGVYGGTLLGLNYLWYKDYPRSKFHFFNDSKEWQQVDKIGHMQTAYFESVWMIQAFRWAGVEHQKAAWVGGSVGFILQTSIEILDGFSEKWGASPSDLLANSLGSALAVSQELIWEEQRIWMKYSNHYFKYPKGELRDRAESLYGMSAAEIVLKDYNRQVFWFSFNTASFFPNQKRAKWLNVAVGYGAGNMYGGFENVWDDEGVLADFRQIKRYRQFFISLDADLTKIETNSDGLKIAFWILNIFKLPAPAIEVNTLGEIIVHPIYFLNWDIPFYIKN